MRNRIGVIEDATLEAVATRTDKLLARSFNVPHSFRVACTNALVDRVRRGLIDEPDSHISAELLHQVIKQHLGEPSGPSVFVAPTQFEDLKARLAQKHFVLILGDAGVGKTTAARGLALDLAREPEPYVVQVAKLPSDLAPGTGTPERVLVLADDPFVAPGDPVTREWTVAIQRFGAAPDRKLVVTSRRELLPRVARPRPDPTVEHLYDHSFPLAEIDYDGAQLLTAHIDDAAHRGQDARWLHTHNEIVTQRLKRPADIATLVQRACELQMDERTADRVKSLASDVKESAIRHAIQRMFEGESESVTLGLATILLAVEARVATRPVLQRIEDDLRDLRAEVITTAERLAKYGWVDFVEDRIWTNSSRISALVNLLENHRALRALTAETAIIAAAGRGDVELVLSLRRASRRTVRLRLLSTTTLASALERWLLEAANRLLADFARTTNNDSAVQRRVVRSSEARFKALMVALALDGSNDQPTTWLVRALVSPEELEGPQTVRTTSFESWEAPSWDDSTMGRVVAAAETKPVVRAFICAGLPTLSPMLAGADEVVTFLFSLADVSADFVDVVERIDDVSPFAGEIIARGAVRSKAISLEGLIERGLQLIAAADHTQAEGARDFDEDEYEAFEHLGDQHYHNVHGAESLIDAALEEHGRRRSTNWAGAQTNSALIRRFAERVERRLEKDPRGIVRVIRALPQEGARTILRAAAKRRELTGIVVEQFGTLAPTAWGEILTELLEAYDADDDGANDSLRLARIRFAALQALRGATPLERVLVIAGTAKATLDAFPPPLLDQLGEHEKRAVRALEGAPDEPGAEATALLIDIANGTSTMAAPALLALARHRVPLAPWLAWRSSGDPSRVQALVSVVDAFPPQERRDVFAAALASQDSATLKVALERIELPDQDDAILGAIARLATQHRTRSVRLAAVKSLRMNRSPAATDALVAALGDVADTSEDAKWGYQYYDDTPPPLAEYGIAATAAEALAERRPWDAPLAERVAAFLGSGSKTVTTVVRSLGEVE